MFLLGSKKHGMCFCYIKIKFVALKSTVKSLEVVIQLSHIIRLVAKTGIISTHGDITILESNGR